MKKMSFTTRIIAFGIILLMLGVLAVGSGAKSADDFKDVGRGDWFYSAVDFAVERGLMNGTTDNIFDPNGKMTRAQIVTILWRLEGASDMPYMGKFSDVPNGKYYTDAVLWAAQNGVVTGTSDTTFAPESPITREQLAAIFYRFADMKNVGDDVAPADIKSFGDHGDVHGYAEEAISWAVGAGLIKGSDGRLDPRGNATRAQVATIMQRFITSLLERPTPSEETPYIFYHGNTVALPGDIVTVTGENLDAVTGVAIDGSNITMLQPNRSSFKFELPNSLEPDLAYECTLKTTGGDIKLTVNEPVVVWSQGDEGKTATPGGWIRVNGECLKLGNHIGTLELTASGEKFSLTADDIKDSSSIGFTVPNDIPHGTYTARYSNGSAVSEKFEVEIAASPRDSWPTDVFNILDYGAVAAHTGYTSEVNFDNSDALRAALKAAGDNGGGIVYFPRGSYHMTDANFLIPENTVIRGEGMNLVRVFWGGESGSGWTVDTLPSCIFKSRNGNCALEDITFQGALMPTFLEVGNNLIYYKYGENVYVRHCRIWSNMYAKDNGFWSRDDGKYTDEDIEKYNSLTPSMFVARCQNFQITDCELEWDTTVLGTNDAFKLGYYKNLLFRDCELMRTGCHCMIDGGIVEDNSFTGTPKGSFVFGINGENCYFSRNFLNEGADSGDRESLSSDWNAATRYHGSITFTDDTHVIFPDEAALNNLTDITDSYFRPRIAVQIIAGTGAGQYRYITERRVSALTLESPFDIWDETSEFTCARLNSHWYIIDNKFKNTGDCQFYTGQTDSVFQGNLMYYAGGFQTVGTEIYGSWQIAWNISYVGNRIEAGIYYFRFGNDGHSKFQAMAQGDPGLRINIGMTVRRNEFLDESFAEIYTPESSTAGSDMILEDNFFKDTHWGYRFSGNTCFKRTIMCGNHYENVDIPYISHLTNPDDLLILD